MNKIITFSILVLSLLFLTVGNATAQNSNPFGNNADTINIGKQLESRKFGVPAPAQGGIVGTVLKNAISLLFIVGGIGVLIYFIWGALDWILSGGDKEKVASARKKITNAIIGLILLSLSYFIVGLVGDIVGYNPLQPIQIKSLGEQ